MAKAYETSLVTRPFPQQKQQASLFFINSEILNLLNEA
jgi:hypothetical protein